MVAREGGDARGGWNENHQISKITFDAVKSVNTAGWATTHPVRSCDSCDFAIHFCAAKKTPTLMLPHIRIGMRSHDQHDFASVFSVSRIKNCCALPCLASSQQRSGSAPPLFGDIVQETMSNDETRRLQLRRCQGRENIGVSVLLCDWFPAVYFARSCLN